MEFYKSPEYNKKAQRLFNGFWITSILSSALGVGCSELTGIQQNARLFLGGALFVAVCASLLFLIAGIKLRREAWAAEKQVAQQKQDAQDTIMFGKPLREIEL